MVGDALLLGLARDLIIGGHEGIIWNIIYGLGVG